MKIKLKTKRVSQTLSRREFLTLTAGTSLALLAAGCGRRKKETPIPNPPAISTSAPLETRPTPSGTPDLVIKNGKVFTMDQGNTTAQAVAIKDGLIQAVGKDKAISALAGPATQVIDAGGRVVTPGLIDPHIHMRAVGFNYTYYTPFMPPETVDNQSLQEALAKVIQTKAPGEWIMGYYMVDRDGIFTKDVIDPVSPDNPVFIIHIGGHWGTANSAAMKAANVTAATKDPTGGIIDRGKNGEPTGIFYNHRAMDVLRIAAPPITDDITRDAILQTQPVLAAAGVTSFQDNNIRDLGAIKAYQDLSRDGQMYLRNDLYYTLEWPSNLDKIGEIDHFENEFSHFTGYKFLIDGQVPTAFCHQPHNGKSWNTSAWDPPTYKKAIRTLHDTGLQICVHCVGDAATDLTLDAYEEAMNANPRPDPRHRIEHAILTTPQATKRIKDLGVVMSVNPQFIFVGGDTYESIFGKDRLKRIIVTREWLDAGIHVTIGSDAPSVPWPTPQVTIAGAISRLTFSQNVIGQDQCLTVIEALRAHTIEAAYAAHQENIKGSVEAGKLADITIWPIDPTSASLKELFNMAPMFMTIVGGKVVHKA